MSEDIEDVSFLPGDSLNRRSVYEPSIRQRCKQLVCSQGRATAIIVIVGLFILIIALVASLARPGGSNTQCNVDTHLKDNTPSKIEQTTPSYIATNNQTFPWHNVRLPRTVLPISYDIQLHADLKGKVFNGHVEISCKVFDKTNSVVLHSKDLNLKSIKIQSPKPVNVMSHLEYVANEQVYIALDREVTIGETFKLIFDIDGRLDKKLMGFYLSSYKDKNGVSKYLATTQFESTAARQAFPCFDEPDMKATFTMSIIHDPEYYSLFNTPLNSSANYKDGLVIDKFQTTVKMSTYLVAFIVCDFKSISNTTKHGTKVTVHAPEDQIYQASYALEVAVSCLEYFDEMFGVPYPLPKQDLVAIPDFSAGAMENWGLITFRMVSVLYDPKRSSYSSKEWVALSVTHELAHQWFGNLVTLKWWDDLWLNEGFASFVEYLGTGRAEPTWQMPEQFVSVDLQRALARDSLKSSHPIQIHVHSPDQINEIFDDISYHKGASLIRMLKSCLGEKVFNDGITAYLNKYKYGNAVTEDLWNVLSETAGNNMNIKDVMDTWTKQMGYPVITVNSKGSQVSLSQKRFLLFPNSTLKEGFNSTYDYKWQVPFTYMVMNKNGTMTKSKEIVWIKDVQGPTLTVPADAKFIKGNVGLFGFYRVNYDVDTWEAIINQLNQNHLVFSQSDRAGLLSDAFAFSRAGLIPITIPLDITKYLTKETDYLPWDAAMNGLSYIKHRLLYDPIFPTFKKYVLHLMDNLIHNSMKWTDDNNDITQMQKMLRTLLLNEAVYLNDEHCVNKGRELFQNWKTNTSNINPDLRSVIQTAGIKYGTEEDWMFVWDQYNNDTVPTEKIQLLTALSTSQNIILLHRLLEDGTEGKAIKHQDLSRLISNVGSNVYGQLLAWRFVRRNWDNLLKWFGGTAFSMSELILGTTSEFSYKFDLEEVQDFFKDKDAGPGQTAIQTTVEKIQMNVQWMEANQKTVTKWLTANVN